MITKDDDKVGQRAALRISKWQLAVGVAALTVGTFVAVMQYQAVSAKNTTSPPEMTVSQPTLPNTPSPTASEQGHFEAAFADSHLSGDVTWLDHGVEISAQLTLRGQHAKNRCSVKLAFEARRAGENQVVTGDERGCNNTDSWPAFEPVRLIGSAIARLDILVLVQNEPVGRVICPRRAACYFQAE